MTATDRPLPRAAGAARRMRPGLRLLAAAAAIALLLSAVGAALAWRNYHVARGRVTDDTASLVRTTAAQTDRVLRDYLDLLQTVSAAPVVRAAEPNAMEVYFTYLAATQPSLERIAWVDRDGVRRAGARGGNPSAPPLRVADRDYFQEVVRTGKPFVGGAILARTDGQPVIPFAVPTRDDDGSLSGVIASGITLADLDRLVGGFSSGRTRVLMVDRSGRLVADGVGSIGIAADANPPLVERARTDGTGYVTGAADPRGDDDRLVAFAPLPTMGGVLFVSRPDGAAFAPARRTLIAELAVLLVVAGVGLAGAVTIGRELDRLVDEQQCALAESDALARENQRLYHEAKDAIRVRDEVLSGVSHDLKTPLTAIKTQAQLLARQLRKVEIPQAPLLGEGLASIDATTVRMAAMLSEIMDVVRLQVGQPLDLHLQPTDLVALVHARARMFEHGPANRHIDVETSEPSLIGHWDSARIERVIDNLLSNAIKYSPDGGAITVTIARDPAAERDHHATTVAADRSGGNGSGRIRLLRPPEAAAPPALARAVLTVRDGGLGIPAKDLPHIFDRFHRAGNVGLIEGSGIGLAGVRQIVEQHGGTIYVRSREGHGSTFVVRLPLD